MKWKIFVKSGIGALEYKLCEFLNCTPKELNEKRKENPAGLRFLTEYMIHEANLRKESREEARRRARH